MKETTYGRTCILFAALSACALSSPAQAPPPSARVLYEFNAPGYPFLGAEVSPGKFVGVTEVGTTIFGITSAGNYQTIYTFPQAPSGSYIASSPIQALDGKAYGFVANTGSQPTSELFSIGAKAAVAIVPFSGGYGPIYLVQAPDNSFYTFFGSNPTNIEFSRMDYQGRTTPLYLLPPNQGVNHGGFLYGSDGNFYGFNLLPGGANAGIFRLTPGGSFSWLVPTFSLGKYGLYYPNTLIQATNGSLYGTAPQGGSANAGTVYEVSLDGQFRTVYQFQNEQLGIPETLLQASDGLLYGTTQGLYNGYSSLFRLDPSTGNFETELAFKGGFVAVCPCAMLQGSDGKLYGSSVGGGNGRGSIFVVDLGLPKPQPLVSRFNPPSAPVGQTVLLWGSNLLAATAVSFNGTAATSFKVPSSQGIWVQVPAGATSGPVTVTTPNGTYTTTQSFTVN